MQHHGVPEALKNEHEQLHGELVRALDEHGELGDAVRTTATLIERHHVNEEAYALPLLRLLPDLSRGRTAPQEDRARALGQRLQEEMPGMLQEHRQIRESVERLAEAARRAGRPEYMALSNKLLQHMRTEEEVLYPAAVLVGRYLDLKQRK